MAVSRLDSSMMTTSDLRKYRSDGYSMHQTSLRGRCFAAEDINAAAPSLLLQSTTREKVFQFLTLSYPYIRMIQETESRAHKFPDPHFLEKPKFA